MNQTLMPPDERIAVKTVHVVYTDRTGYSLLPLERQAQLAEELRAFVASIPEYQRAVEAKEVVPLDTGDGFALVFLNDPQAAANVALLLNDYSSTQRESPLRIGVHTGPVTLRTDLSGRANASGPGIDLAARVMSCAEPGSVLLSRAMAEQLEAFEAYRMMLRDEGLREVKHSVQLHVYALGGGRAVSRSPLPTASKPLRAKRFGLAWVVGAALLVVIGVALGLLLRPSGRQPTIADALTDQSTHVGTWVSGAAWAQTFVVPTTADPRLDKVTFQARVIDPRVNGQPAPAELAGELLLYPWDDRPERAGGRLPRVQGRTPARPLARSPFRLTSRTFESVEVPFSSVALEPGRQYALVWHNLGEGDAEFGASEPDGVETGSLVFSQMLPGGVVVGGKEHSHDLAIRIE